ncbi:gem (nuclear organelle) associated protein 2 [Apophysomyces sp. BC1021]|nr:gem (nuclear organelle) associated protein 2 [Apophysomyces sp. BC1021]
MSRRVFSQHVNDDDQQTSSKSVFSIGKTQADLVDGIPVTGEDYLLLVRDQAKKCAQTVVAEPPKTIEKLNLPAHYQFTESTLPTESKNVPLPTKAWQDHFVESFRSYQEDRMSTQPKSHELPKTPDEWHTLCYSTDIPLDEERLEIISSMSQSLWIFSLLVHLDPVLTSDSISILRDLARVCIQLRNKKEAQDDQVARLNIIITIIAKVFGQADLV